MKDTLLTEKQKKEIVKSIREKNHACIIDILEKIKTNHANTAKTKDKRFVISEIVRHVLENSIKREEDYFAIGNYFCGRKEDVSKEIGISLIWRAYKIQKKKVEEIFLNIADDPNWEIREYAGTAFANTLFHNHGFYKTLQSWSKHNSENIRRAVVISIIGLRDKTHLKEAFALMHPMLFDNSKYVKKNLGPFILGSYYGNKFPVETFKHLKKWSKIRDENVRWNVIMAFNNSYGNRYPEYALELFNSFKGDVDLSVKRAMISTLKFLGKRHGKKVNEFLKKNKLNLIKDAY